MHGINMIMYIMFIMYDISMIVTMIVLRELLRPAAAQLRSDELRETRLFGT